MKLVTLIFVLLFAGTSFAMLPKHEVNLSATSAIVGLGNGTTEISLKGDYGYGFNENVQLVGSLTLLSAGSTVTFFGFGARYNFDPVMFMKSYFATAKLYVASAGGSTIEVAGGKRFRLSRHVAYAPKASLLLSGGEISIMLYPIQFSFSTDEFKFL